jgi:hypothetical protein
LPALAYWQIAAVRSEAPEDRTRKDLGGDVELDGTKEPPLSLHED